MKTCARCKRELPREMFTAAPRMTSGLKSYCRDCCRDHARERYAANPDRIRAVSRAASRRRYTPESGRARHLMDMYGLTVSAYREMLASQHGGCGICSTSTPGGKGDWHVDHDHTTRAVRGLLCATCNVAIGMMGDDPARLRSAAAYLESFTQEKAG